MSRPSSSQQRNKVSSSDQPVKSPQVLISESFESIKKIIELDIDSSLVDLSSLENLNNTASLKYKSFEKTFNEIDEDIKDSEDIQMDFEQMDSKIKSLENYVDKLETLTDEICEWSKELEVRSRRYFKK